MPDQPTPSPKTFLGPPITADYMPMAFSSAFITNRHRPVFTPDHVREMLGDPRVLFGLWLIKGPIQDKAKFEIECDDQEVVDFCLRQLDRFWRNSLDCALKSLEWGFSGSEVMYSLRTQPAPPPSPFGNDPSSPPDNSLAMAFNAGKKQNPKSKSSNSKSSNPKSNIPFSPKDYEDQSTLVDPYTQEQAAQDPGFAPGPQLLIEFDRLRDIHSTDLKAVTYRGELMGMFVNRTIGPFNHEHNQTYIGNHKKFWHVHWPERNPFYGLSRLFGCFIPWWEKWCDGGYRDIRRLWFHKNAFEGGTFYFPPSGSARDENGNIVSNQQLARELLEKKRTGGMMFLPGTVLDDRGTRAWEHIPASSTPVPAGLLDYGALLDKEILEGIGVPTEIIESSGEQGFGASSGRQVPETAFYAILQGIVNPLADAFKKQVLEPLVAVNFGPGIDFEVIPVPMTASTEPADPMANAPVDPQTGEPLPPPDPNGPPQDGPPPSN